MRKYLLYLLGATLLIPSCSKEFDRAPEETPTADAPAISAQKGLLYTEGANPGVVRIRVSRQALGQIRLNPEGGTLRSASASLATSLEKIEATSVTPLFEIDPRFEKRMRKAGLDQWFTVRFSEARDLRSVLVELQSVPEVEIAEPSYMMRLPDVSFKPHEGALRTRDATTPDPFDDPRLPDQWHYHNRGTLSSKHVAGADINLYEAWRTTTGRPDVIVSIVDGGVDPTHPDLVDNLWYNVLERDGAEGVDDDGNGKVDDITGFNFIHHNGTIYPDAVSHGTHVAGTVGARSNNGIGVCGVAGGNHLIPGTGIKLMSCQTFGRRVGMGMENGDDAPAIVYGANNGAVISQNSWGYPYPGISQMPTALKAAIDYFIEYAGCDDDGNQLATSPMKGGVVIFAAGNDEVDFISYPGAYAPTVAVSAMGPDWKMAYYSTRGAWVDIMAPGGNDRISKGEVLSTVAPSIYNGAEYGYMQGTSMACPHVSGIAALIVSHYGGPGFTSKELEKKLLGAFRPKNIDLMNPLYVGRIGRGYIDAGKVFAEDGGKAPGRVTTLTADPISFLHATATWSAVADEDDGVPVEYRLYLSESPINSVNYLNAYLDKINGVGYEVGDKLSYKLNGLKDNTPYYMGIEAIDRWGNVSELVTKDFRTLKNNAPTLESTHKDPIRIFGRQKARFTVTAKDQDDHKIRFAVTGTTLKGVSHSSEGNELSISISAVLVGKHTLTVTATDELGASVSLDIPFEVYKYSAPVFTTDIATQVIGTNGTNEIDLSAIIDNSSNQPLTYTVSSDNSEIVSPTVSSAGILSLQGRRNGLARISVEVNDGTSTISTSFAVRVAENINDVVYSVYPVPARSNLNITLNPKVNNATVEIISLTGLRVYNKTYTIGGAKPLPITVSKLTPGIYTLKVTTNIGVYTKTFTKV